MDATRILDLLGLSRKTPKGLIDELLENGSPSEDGMFLAPAKPKISDEKAILLIKKIGYLKHCGDLALAEKTERDKVVVLLKEAGLSIRQISRLTVLSRVVIHNL